MSKKRSQSNVEKTYVRIRPRILTKPLLNPHKGIATFQHFNGEAGYPSWYNWNESGPTEFAKFKGRLKNTKYPQTTVSYCRWYWKVLEPEKRKYRWDIIDGALKAGRERGQTLHIRVMPHSGSPVRMGGDTSVPDWYEDSGPKEPGGSWFREREGLPGFKERGLRVPCYNSQRYLKDWGDFIRAFGKRYDGHENLDCFEIAFIGAWGEGDGKITKPQIERIVDVYKKAFKKTHLITMSRAHQFEYAVGLGAGWRADSLGDLGLYAGPERLSNIKGPGWSHMYDEYIKYVATSREKRIWEKAPVVFEPSTTIIQWVRDGYDINWIIEQALKWHATVFSAKSCWIPDEAMDAMIDFGDRMGYKFLIRQAMLPLKIERGKKVHMQMWLDNVGCAPLYYDYEMALRFRQGKKAVLARSKSNVRQWMPGDTWIDENFALPDEITRGKVKVDIGLVKRGGDEAKVRFANVARKDGWVELTEMTVK